MDNNDDDDGDEEVESEEDAPVDGTVDPHHVQSQVSSVVSTAKWVLFSMTSDHMFLQPAHFSGVHTSHDDTNTKHTQTIPPQRFTIDSD